MPAHRDRPLSASAGPALVLRPPLLVEAGRALAVLESVLPGGADQRALPLSTAALAASLEPGVAALALCTQSAELECSLDGREAHR